MPRPAMFHLPRGVLRRLMQQVGLSPSAARSKCGTQLLRRINTLGSDTSRDDDADDAASDSDSDGYDTVCDCDDWSSDDGSRDGGSGDDKSGDDKRSDDGSGDAPVRVSSSNRNNNGTQSGRPSDTEPLEASDSNGPGASGVSNLQSRMDSVIMSAIESLRNAYDSLIELENPRLTQQTSNSQLTNKNDEVVDVDDNSDTEDSESTASEQRFTVASSLNESTNCRRGGVASPEAEMTSSPLGCVGEEVPPLSTSSPRSPPSCSTIDRAANQLVRVAATDKGPAAQEIAKRWLRHRKRQARRQRVSAPPHAASRLTERLDNLELLLLALQQPLVQQRQKGLLGSAKLDSLAALKRNLGCLQAHLLRLQARELSQSAGDQHKRLNRTWNFRRDWKPVEPKRGRLSVNMLEPAPGLSRRPAKRDRWLLKFLPAGQRRALPQLMRSVGFHDLAPMPGTAAAAAIPVTRARGRPVVASHNMRDPRNDVMQRFLHALKP